MAKKKKKRKNPTLGNYNKNKAYIKGKVFELVLKELLIKAGFSTDIDTDQVTKDQKKLHGRGATYAPDFFGKFTLGIPFINPLMLVAEAKYYNSRVKLKHVREFLGAYIDFSQFTRINTKKGGEKRYSVLYSPRYTYCPVFFSIKGFDKSAEGFMYAHGINYVSYNNSDIMEKIFKKIEALLNKINFARLTPDDFKKFHSLDTIPEIRDTLKKTNFQVSFDRLNDYLKKINSLIGILDLRFPINILYSRKISASKLKKINLSLIEKGHYFIKNTSGRKFGEFSLNKGFIEGYVKHARKNNKLDSIFKQIDIIFPNKGNLEIVKFEISDESKNLLLGDLEN